MATSPPVIPTPPVIPAKAGTQACGTGTARLGPRFRGDDGTSGNDGRGGNDGRRGDNGRGGDRSAGFLVVEVVVALAILALGFGYAMRSLSGALDRLGGSRHAMEALAMAQSTLDRVGSEIALGRGEVSGRTREGYDWVVETAPYVSPALADTGPLVGYSVSVTVVWRERGNARQVRLNTLRLAPREPPA